MNFFNIDTQFQLMKERGWDKIYFAIDFHDTIIESDYEDTKKIIFAPFAEQVLKRMSNSSRIGLIAYTCSYPDEIERYLKFFRGFDIKFDFINENTEVQNNRLGCFDNKPYFNVLLENKAGFDMNSDWYIIDALLDKYI